MGLTKYKLGELIEPSDERNTECIYGIEDVRGISNLKEMMKTKADLNGRDLSKFQIVRPGFFVFNHRTSRNGSKFSITYNYDSEPHIFTEDYVVFRIKEECKETLLKEWLYLYFCRAEFDRYVITNSWGSSTEFYNWQDLCDLDITLPNIDQQRKFVNVYLSLQNNLAAFQSKVEELKMVCDGYIEELRRNMECEKIGTYIEDCNERNDNLQVTDVQGVESTGNFTETRANTVGLDFHNYKIVKPNQFAYNPSRINLGSIALRDETEGNCIVSPMYIVFKVSDTEKLLPNYLLLWISRSEFLRSTLFYASGSVRDTFDFSEMKEVKIPIPDITVQREIVDIHKCYIERQRIAALLKEQLNNLCPILVKGSMEAE